MIEFMQIIKGNLNEKLPLVIHALLFSSASVPDTFKYTQCHYFFLDFVCVTSGIADASWLRSPSLLRMEAG